MKRVFLQCSRPVLGVLLCSAAAVGAAAGVAHRPWRVFVPFVFVVIIVLLATRYGMAVSVLGSAATALIFAYFLFPPLRSFRVDDSVARANLAWMLLGSIALSFLLLDPKNSDKIHRK